MEMWITGNNSPSPRAAADAARQAEDEGYDGVSFGDTQCLLADPFVCMSQAADATTRIKVTTGVTNPVTRHPATTACAIATLQVQSGGRAVLGIGRGDSAVTKVGLPAANLAQFEYFIERLQGYLRGDVVTADADDSRIQWLGSIDIPKVPVDVAATGPGVISLAARHAERLTFNVGADVEKMAQGVELACRVCAEHGRDPASLSFGAYLPVAPHPDPAMGRLLVRGVTAVYARFQSMPGHPAQQVDPRDADVIKSLAANYDISQHGRSDAPHTDYLPDDFIDRRAVSGDPETCMERLSALVALGLDHLHIVRPSRLGPPDDVAESLRLLSETVLPAVRRAAK